MRTFPLFAIIGTWLALGGCHPRQEGADVPPKAADSVDHLLARRERIVRQLDSLSKILHVLDEKIARENASELPFITAYVVKPTSFDQYLDIQGSVKTDGNVTLAPEASGKVVAILHEEGDIVPKGAVILRLDDEALRHQLGQLRTQYQLAKTTYHRQLRLYKEGVIPEMEYLQAKTRKNALEKQIAALRAQLKKMAVTAPISGKLDALDVRKGEVVAPLRPIGRMINLRDLYLESDISERFLPIVQEGKNVQVYFPVFDSTLTGKVRYVGSFIHPTNRTFKVEVALDNRAEMLRPNLTGILHIHTYHADNVLVVPLDLIQEDRTGASFVYVLDSTETEDVYKVRRQPVKVGRTYKQNALVEDGLRPGDLVAATASRGLSEGQLVRLAEPHPLP